MFDEEIKVLSTTENEDGSLLINFEISKEAAELFIQYAIKDIIMKAVEKTKKEQKTTE